MVGNSGDALSKKTKRPRVLLVDDEDDIRLVARLSLGSSGCDVVDVANSADALAALESEIFDVVLLDKMLRGEDGVDLLRALRARADLPQPRVAMFTSSVQPDDIRSFHEAGADEVIKKPFVPQQLGDVVRALAERES